jgi:hypothetical protein
MASKEEPAGNPSSRVMIGSQRCGTRCCAECGRYLDLLGNFRIREIHDVRIARFGKCQSAASHRELATDQVLGSKVYNWRKPRLGYTSC